MTEVMKRPDASLAVSTGVGRGFEKMDVSKITMPRVKVMQGLSPELEDPDYSFRQGDIIHGLLMEKMPEKFVPISIWDSRILFPPRGDEDGGILCRSLDGKTGPDGEVCANCPKSQWDDADGTPPECADTINVLALFEGYEMPVVISFAVTNYKYGRKFKELALFSGAGDAWNKVYKLTSKKESNSKGTFYTTPVKPAGFAPEEVRLQAETMYHKFAGAAIEVVEHNEQSETDTSEKF